jgi:hypothetical protein
LLEPLALEVLLLLLRLELLQYLRLHQLSTLQHLLLLPAGLAAPALGVDGDPGSW